MWRSGRPASLWLLLILHTDKALWDLQSFTSQWPKAGPPDMTTQPPALTGWKGIWMKDKDSLISKPEFYQPVVTRLMLVPVWEGERQRGAIVRKPPVLPLLLLVLEADPIVHAAVGSIRTQQTVDKSLLKPATVRMREEKGWEEAWDRLNKN